MCLHANLDAVLPGADDDAQRDRAGEGVKITRPLMLTLRVVALHNACAPTTQSGQCSALAKANVSKGVAHRGENPGGQYAHTAQALLGQQD